MKRQHLPVVDGRYWAAITLASLFGTNLGDLYAHNSGLGLLGGLPILAVLAAAVFAVEARDLRPRELYYWLVIIIIRTGATNIADFGKKAMWWPAFALLLLAAFLGLAAASARAGRTVQPLSMPATGAIYWSAMLAAGVLGTFYGDMAAKALGKGGASLVLGALLAAALLARRRWGSDRLLTYWIAVAIARTAGTAMGDWLAESKLLAIGLPAAAAITGTAFLLVLTLWKRPPGETASRPAGDGIAA